jgi:UDP-2,3-diacylglucosamine pyrophosphatase LpxH
LANPLHTFVVSDLHLTEAEPVDPERPLWKRYKQADLSIDVTFGRWLERVRADALASATAPVDLELVLAGDVFDFDAVMAIPEEPPWPVHWLERRRGLDPEEDKSRFKMEMILRDHAVWVAAIRDFIVQGGRVVFVIGNHDVELHWKAVQRQLLEALDLPTERADAVRFCEWFYISDDTLIEHGNQYDAYCMCINPISPCIMRRGRSLVRLPFGDVAGKLMVNGMGLFNPHVESSFVMTFPQYLRFFYKYLIRIQPLLVWTWLWGASATLFRSLSDGLRPALRDPLSFSERIDGIGKRANASSTMALALQQLQAHPAIYSPFKILRELWLDRALLVIGLLYATFQALLVINAIVPVPILWTFPIWVALSPLLMFYARSVQSDVYAVQKAALEKIPTAARIAGVTRVIHGHTHREVHTTVEGVEHLNGGTWSPAYSDPECTKRVGRKCFVWLAPVADGEHREATLHAWQDPDYVLLSGDESVQKVRWTLFPRPPVQAESRPSG